MAVGRLLLQSVIVAFNVLCASAGVLVLVGSFLGWSSQALWEEGSSSAHLEESLQILIGSILITAALMGCFGAINASVRVVLLFIALLLLLIGSHSWCLWRYDESRLKATTKLMLSYTWIEDLVDPGKMQQLQEQFSCCGIEGADDYTDMGLEIPPSCFQPLDEMTIATGNRSDYTPLEPFTKKAASLREGCQEAITRFNLFHYRLKRWCHIGFLVAEFLGIVLANAFIFNITADTLRYSY